MQKHIPEELIRKYLAGTCNDDEKALVESWHLKELADNTFVPDEEQINKAHQHIQVALDQHIHAARRRTVIRRTMFRVAAAAIVAGFIFTVAYLYYIKVPNNNMTVQDKLPTILPGRDGAVLTLADGNKIVLDSLGNGQLPAQPGANVLLNNGQLIYHNNSSNITTASYNTISTPRARQFKIALPDGSQVWLNAASTLRYPTVFTGSERKVFVTGEAYFEIKKLPLTGKAGNMPFKVSIEAASGAALGEVEVLGTHFNINAYDDEEAVRTTLLEGKVRVSKSVPLQSGSNQQSAMEAGRAVVLKPGEQAVLAAANSPTSRGFTIDHSPLTIHHSPDLEQVVAWKNGVFNFQDATLEQVMRQLARWYDIEVVYEKGIPEIEFEGEMNRQNELTSVLHSLERLGVHFKIQGRRLTVLP